jgi:hypothetical protein
MKTTKRNFDQNERKRDDDPRRDIKDPPVHDDKPEPTEPEGDPKPNVPPIKVQPRANSQNLGSVGSHDRRTCRMCGKLFVAEPDLVDHEITIHPNVKGPNEHHDGSPDIIRQ